MNVALPNVVMDYLCNNHDQENCISDISTIEAPPTTNSLINDVVKSHDQQLLLQEPAEVLPPLSSAIIMPHPQPHDQGTVIESNIEIVTTPIDMDFHSNHLDPDYLLSNNDDVQETILSENTDHSFSLNFETSSNASVQSDQPSEILTPFDPMYKDEDDPEGLSKIQTYELSIKSGRPSLDMASVLHKSITPRLSLVRSPVKPTVGVAIDPHLISNEPNKKRRRRRNNELLMGDMRVLDSKQSSTGYGTRSRQPILKSLKRGLRSSSKTLPTEERKRGVSSKQKTVKSSSGDKHETVSVDTASEGRVKNRSSRKKGLIKARSRKRGYQKKKEVESVDVVMGNEERSSNTNKIKDEASNERKRFSMRPPRVQFTVPAINRRRRTCGRYNNNDGIQLCSNDGKSNESNPQQSNKGNGAGTGTRDGTGTRSGAGKEGSGRKRTRGRQPGRQSSGGGERSDDNSAGSPSKRWRCEFCGLGNNVKDLGYLYGPYWVTTDAACDSGSGSHLDCNGTQNPNNSPEEQSAKKDNKSVWVHSGCVYWSPGVCLVGDRITGLEDAVNTANKTVCIVCGNKGAVLCCDIRTCRKCYHYPCAVETDCVFNADKYTITCAKHKSSNGGSSTEAPPTSSDKDIIVKEGLTPSTIANAYELTTPTL